MIMIYHIIVFFFLITNLNNKYRKSLSSIKILIYFKKKFAKLPQSEYEWSAGFIPRGKLIATVLANPQPFFYGPFMNYFYNCKNCALYHIVRMIKITVYNNSL